MARPKLGESESKRLQMVITEDELRAIEDWQFANRVPSKSEAIRRLCQIGLLVDNELEQIVDTAFEVLHAVEADWFEASKDMRELVGPGSEDATLDKEAVTEALQEGVERCRRATEALDGLHIMTVSLFNAIAPFAEAKTVGEGKERSQEAIEVGNARLDELHRQREEAEYNMRLVTVWASLSPEEIESYKRLSNDEQDALFEARIEQLRKREEEGLS